ncbi:MAG: adenylate/guanylate cyclase domain-containing protein [Pseudomonadota bacterium]
MGRTARYRSAEPLRAMTSALPRWVAAIALVSGLVWAGMLGKQHLDGKASVIDRFETVLLDLRIKLAGQRPAPKDITIVAIDDRTVSEAGTYPLSRKTLADLIVKIREAGAAALAIDILLSGGSTETDDAALAAALQTLPTVIAVAAQVAGTEQTASAVPVVREALGPDARFTEAASEGLVNIVTDDGGTPRHIPVVFLSGSGLQPSFSLKALERFSGEAPSITGEGVRIGGREQPLDLGWHLALNYYGPAEAIETISAASLLRGDPIDLHGRLAVLGVTATAVGDRFATPFDPVMPGVEIQATGIANLLDGTALLRNSRLRLTDAAAALTITLLGCAAIAFLPLAPAVFFYLALLSGWLVLTLILFGQGQWLNAALPFAASLPPVIALLLLRQVFERLRSQKLARAREALSRFQSPKLAGRVAEDPSFLAVPKEQTAAMLFIDLSGYTGLSEALGPVRTRDFLKDFHTIVVDVVSRYGGVVLDFMGDGAMLGFGIPDASEDDPENAARCSFLLERAVGAWIEETGMSGRISRVRVGAHVGQVVLSRLGHDSQQQIAATGDCVNVAARLLEVAKDHDASVVLSADLMHAAAQSGADLKAPRQVTVAIRGRQQELTVGLWRPDENPLGSEDPHKAG